VFEVNCLTSRLTKKYFICLTEATYAFGKLELIRIYQDMSRMVLHELAAYLRKIKMEKPHFDLSDDDNFKTAVRTLNVFDKKINYLIQRGFK
jgi:hypothetical protein